MSNSIKRTLNSQKRIALIAHDNMKGEIMEWCEANKENPQPPLLSAEPEPRPA